MTAPKATEAQCPHCKTWSPVEWDESVTPGGLWWVDSGCCPACDKSVLVTTECEFRRAVYSGASPREFVRMEACLFEGVNKSTMDRRIGGMADDADLKKQPIEPETSLTPPEPDPRLASWFVFVFAPFIFALLIWLSTLVVG